MAITRRGFLGGLAAAAAAAGLGMRVEESVPKLHEYPSYGLSIDEIVAAQPMMRPIEDLEVTVIYLNGLMLIEDTDYRIIDDTFQFEESPRPGDVITCLYRDSEEELTTVRVTKG